MYEKDYILRIIEQAGVMLRAMLTAIREQRPQDVDGPAREALTLILGLPSGLTDSLTPAGLLTLLSTGGGLDATRARLAAEVYVRRVQADRAMGLTESTDQDVAKALRLIGAVIESGEAGDVAEARALLAELDDRSKPGGAEPS